MPEFYRYFWNLLGLSMVSSFNFAFRNGTLSISQCQGIISLILKKKKEEGGRRKEEGGRRKEKKEGRRKKKEEEEEYQIFKKLATRVFTECRL